MFVAAKPRSRSVIDRAKVGSLTKAFLRSWTAADVTSPTMRSATCRSEPRVSTLARPGQDRISGMAYKLSAWHFANLPAARLVAVIRDRTGRCCGPALGEEPRPNEDRIDLLAFRQPLSLLSPARSNRCKDSSDSGASAPHSGPCPRGRANDSSGSRRLIGKRQLSGSETPTAAFRRLTRGVVGRCPTRRRRTTSALASALEGSSLAGPPCGKN